MQHSLLCFVGRSPWRIVDDCGGAFTMGALGGGLFQLVKGFRNAPAVSSRQGFSMTWCKGPVYWEPNLIFQGLGHRLRGSTNAVRMRAPQIGGTAARSNKFEIVLMLDWPRLFISFVLGGFF